MTPAVQLSIADINDQSQLTAEVRMEVWERERICLMISKAKNQAAGIREAVASGYKAGTVKRWAQRWELDGWRGLVNRAKLTRSAARLDIGDVFKSYCERNQRSSAQAHRDMLRDFKADAQFPDVGDWRAVFAAENPDEPVPLHYPADWCPRGWSYDNLMFCAGLSRYEIKATRVGRGAAREFLPSVLSTRIGLPVGAIYMFDDMWHDAKVNFGGNTKAQRIIEIACVDVASACRFAYGLKPRLENLDTGKMKNLNEADMRMIVAHVLINVGYHPAGCTLVVEHGTAAVSLDNELLIGKLSGGVGEIVVRGKRKFIDWSSDPVVKISRGGLISKPIHKGLFGGQPRGNYKRKAALESQHSLCHTVAAALAGQVGKDRDHSPEQMYGLEKYNNSLIKCAVALPLERAKLLAYPLLHYHQYVPVIGDLYREMNWRTWHHLEGWAECNNIANEFRLHPRTNDWLAMDSLFLMEAADRERMLIALDSIPALTRSRSMAPQEVWNNGTSALVKLPKSTMPMLLGARLGSRVRVDDTGLIAYFNRDYSASEFLYQARGVIQPNGFKIDLDLGREYMIHINPFATDECFVSSLDHDPSGLVIPGAFVGIAAIWEKVAKTDIEALERMSGKQMAIEAQVRAPIARRGAGEIKKTIDMYKTNNAVLRGDPVTPAEKAEQREIQAATGSLKDSYQQPAEVYDEDEPVAVSSTGSLSDAYRKFDNED